mgnify:CR=1 FL=1
MTRLSDTGGMEGKKVAKNRVQAPEKAEKSKRLGQKVGKVVAVMLAASILVRTFFKIFCASSQEGFEIFGCGGISGDWKSQRDGPPRGSGPTVHCSVRGRRAVGIAAPEQPLFEMFR